MSVLNTQIVPFVAQAFHNDEFVEIDSDRDVLGKWSIFFFYPADFTFVCPTELADLAAHHAELESLGVQVFSVSTDTHFVHKAWHDASPMIATITFPMIGDPARVLAQNFECLRPHEGLADRATFIVDPEGYIQGVELSAEGIGRNAAELVRKIKAAMYVRDNPGQACPANWQAGADTLTPSVNLVGKL